MSEIKFAINLNSLSTEVLDALDSSDEIVTKSSYPLKTDDISIIFDDPIYAPFLVIMKAHGWENLGQRASDYDDWMHFEVCG